MEREPIQEGEGNQESEQQERRETDPWKLPRIYVASLTDYNAGILHGDWVYADTKAAVVVQESIEEILSRSPTAAEFGEVAEEWAIHDYSGFGLASVSEYEPLERVCQLANGISRYGEAFSAWWAQEERSDEDSGDVYSQFEEQYLGEYESLEQYGEQLLDELGASLDILRDMPESLRHYVRLDVEAFVHDLEAGGEIHTARGTEGLHVFSSR